MLQQTSPSKVIATMAEVQELLTWYRQEVRKIIEDMASDRILIVAMRGKDAAGAAAVQF